MGPAAAWAVPAAIGAFGLYQSNQQQNAARKAQQRAGNVTNALGMEQLGALQELRKIADSYNPQDTAKTAIDTASEVSAQTLEKALRRLKVGYGGDGTGDTGYHLSAQRAVNDAFDPLKMFAANEMASAAQKKADMYARILGAPTGQIADSFFKSAALMPRSDPSGSMNLLSQALQRLFGQGGAGGSGDNPSGLTSGVFNSQGFTGGGLIT